MDSFYIKNVHVTRKISIRTWPKIKSKSLLDDNPFYNFAISFPENHNIGFENSSTVFLESLTFWTNIRYLKKQDLTRVKLLTTFIDISDGKCWKYIIEHLNIIADILLLLGIDYFNFVPQRDETRNVKNILI